jgi:hypothetical protein
MYQYVYSLVYEKLEAKKIIEKEEKETVPKISSTILPPMFSKAQQQLKEVHEQIHRLDDVCLTNPYSVSHSSKIQTFTEII